MENNRRERIKKREGTGRSTTRREGVQALLKQNTGPRSGIQVDTKGLPQVDGFILPGQFFANINLNKSNLSSSTSSENEESSKLK